MADKTALFGARRRVVFAGVLALALVVAATATPPAFARDVSGQVPTFRHYQDEGELTASDGDGLGQFGATVAVSASGAVALVGAPGAYGGEGSAYIYVRSNGAWSEACELSDPDGLGPDGFGGSVALSANGQTALIGASNDSDGTGAAYVYQGQSSTCTDMYSAQLGAPDGAKGDSFGFAVSLSGEGLAAVVGAQNHDSAQGAAYTFELDDGTWSETQELTVSDACDDCFFGEATALSANGSTALIGSAKGKAYVFSDFSGAWSQTAEIDTPGGAGDGFGASLALSGRALIALIGAPFANDSSGAAYVYARGHGTWRQVAQFMDPAASDFDNFGYGDALSAKGSTAIIGAYGTNDVEGVAYVLRRTSGVWTLKQELTPPAGAPAGDDFGVAAALSRNGSTAVIGASGDFAGVPGTASVLTRRAASAGVRARLSA